MQINLHSAKFKGLTEAEAGESFNWKDITSFRHPSLKIYFQLLLVFLKSPCFCYWWPAVSYTWF